MLIASLVEGLEAAKEIGLHPIQSALPSIEGAIVPRGQIENLLRGITHRLSGVEATLEQLEAKEKSTVLIAPQVSLMNFYLRSMRAQVDLMKLQINLGSARIDLEALARVAERMADLTADFIASLRAWAGRIAIELVESARLVRSRVQRIVSGTRTTGLHPVWMTPA
jgi:hypothetical protein